MFVKRSKEDRMQDEINMHLRRTGHTLEDEIKLIAEKKSTLTASLRIHAKVMLENKIREGQQKQEVAE